MRVALYARVSSEEQVEGYSIDAQRRAFQTLCEGRRWTPFREYIEEGKSARTEDIGKRPVFRQAMAAGLAHEYDVLVVHKIDRFSRKLRVTLEYFDRLSKAQVGFVSIVEQIDFSTPWGKFNLSVLGGLAELYSDNLSQETKKGWHERRAQGLYCGTLPFGAIKGDAGIPVPDMQDRRVTIDGKEATVRNYEGLTMAFNLAAEGKSDRDIAIALNSVGYRTTGTHGPRLFSKDTVKDMLNNRFYVGFIPNGDGGWIRAKHEPFIDPRVFEEAQKMRAQRTRKPQTIRSDARVYSLSGIARCFECHSTLRTFKGRGRVRLACNGRIKSDKCSQPSTFLDIYERQLVEYLRVFNIPEDYRGRLLEVHKKLQSAYDVDLQRSALEARLKRVKEMYEWGHKTKAEYQADYAAIKRELQQLPQEPNNAQVLERLALFLRDIVVAWETATQEQRNRLATCLFEAVWIKDKKVVAVTPQPDFKPFFDLQYEGLSHGVLHWRPRGDLNP
ncbi:MAG: recombinase family protein [Dehalococcoidia bacterium]|nr:recombinase family protein [Dehalococcoidia bacterium]